jgi:septal ring factor EnvC (AmiA/AmiB activator)
VKYIGPMAQDFYAAFHLGGTDSLGINTMCIDGVNMAGVRALEKRTRSIRTEISTLQTNGAQALEKRTEELRSEITEVREENRQLKTQLEKLQDFKKEILEQLKILTDRNDTTTKTAVLDNTNNQ